MDRGLRTRLGVAALSLAALGARLAHLVRSPEPVGTDGYYYVVQVADLVGTGRLHVPDASWALRVLAGPHWLGLEPVLAVKVGAALLAALVVPAAWLAGRSLAPERSGGGWVLAGWAAASPSLTFLAAEHPKSLGLVAPGLLVVAVGVGRWPPALRWLTLVALALLAGTAHRMGAALLVAGAVGAIAGLVLRWLVGGDRPRIPAWGWALGGLTAIAALGASAWLPGVLHPSDLERVSGQLAPGWPAPWAYLELHWMHPVFLLELSLAWLALLAVPWAGWRRAASLSVLLGLALPLALCLLVPWRRDVLDLGWRLTTLAPLLAAPLLVAVARPRLPGGRGLRWLGAGLLAVTPLLSPLGYDLDSAPPYGAWRELIAVIPRPLPELLIVHQGVAFLYDHETGQEAMSWAPEPELDRARVGRLVVGLRPRAWLACGAEDLPAPAWLPGGYAYLREDTWEALTTCMAADEELVDTLDPRNPTQVRPASMLRNR